MKSDIQIIQELKNFWGCNSFIFSAEFTDKTNNPNKYCGRIINIKDDSGKRICNIETKKPLFFNVKLGTKINVGPCRVELSLADQEFRRSIGKEYVLNFRFLPSTIVSKAEIESVQRIRKNWKLKDRFFIGQIRHSIKDKSKYTVVDIRRSDFSKINTRVIISGSNHDLNIPIYNRYYKFTWKLAPNSTSENPHFYIDTQQAVNLFEPKEIVNSIHNDIIDYPGSASQIIVKTLETLKNQLTASGKEIFIYELLQNANDYPCKTSDGSPIPVNVEFRLTKNYLIFQHTGAFFSPRNIAAICNINDKEKIDNTEAIGYKGIGFKTVFLDNNYVFLNTGDYSFRFDWKESKDILDIPWQILPIWTPLESVDKEIQTAFSSVDQREFKVQFALRPTKHSTLYESEHNYVHLFHNVFETERVLLFIPNIARVSFICEGEAPIIRSKDSDKWCISNLSPADIDDQLRISINKEIEDGDTKIPEKYKDFYKTTIKFACQVEGNKLRPVENTTLYCYLPAKKARLGLPFLMNTDMIPTGPRDDIEDIEVNYHICRIAGRKLCEWIQELLKEGKYQYDSIFSLIPSFDRVTNYEKFINQIEDGFNESLKEIDFIPVLDGLETRFINVSKVIYDTTGITETGLLSDSDLLSYVDGYGLDSRSWNTCQDEFFVHPNLRGKENFKTFIEKYHAEDMIFGIEQLLDLCYNEGFNVWLQNQDNNNKFLEFLLDHNYLTNFIQRNKKIFIGNNGKLYDASIMYYNIDEHLKYLSCFAEDYLLRLSVDTRDYFKNNEAWDSVIENAFKDFNVEDFVDEVLNNEDMKSILKEKNNSISFIHFLAINKVENDSLIDLPFINSKDEIVNDFNKLVFFESSRGVDVKEYDWIDSDWIDFISSDYFIEDKEICIEYLASQFGILIYSDREIVNSIIKDKNNLKTINNSLENKDSARTFIDFIIKNSEDFEDAALVNFNVIVIGKDGSEVYGTSDTDTFLYSAKFEELAKKNWVSDGWMYSLSESYFEGKSDFDKEILKKIFIRLFGIRELTNDIFLEETIIENQEQLIKNLYDIESNIDFWRWVKTNCKEKASKLTNLPVVATNSDNNEGVYIISNNSIYISDSMLPDGQNIESIVKKYYNEALFLSPRYIENNTSALKKEWRKFSEDLGIMSEQIELVFDQIIPNLSNIEDPGVPGMLAHARDYYKDHNVSISDLTDLRLENKDGEYISVSDCIFIAAKKVAEPFKDIQLKNECVLSKYNVETRSLILEIAEKAGATIIENIEDWHHAKISRYLEIQENDEVSKHLHFIFIKELLDINEKELKSLEEDTRRVKLLAQDDCYYNQNLLTLGNAYHPLCDFESHGITDQLIYLANEYASLDNENLGTKIRTTFNVHYRFTCEDIELLCNYSFADFFWRSFISHKKAPIQAIKSMIEDGKFNNKKCVPTPSGDVACPKDLYSRKELREYMKLVSDWSSCYPFDDYSDSTYDILDMLPFKTSLSFNDGLNALMNTEDQTKRYFILKWMSDEYSGNEEQRQLISEYRDGEKSKWRNRNKKKVYLKDLYALDIDENANSKYLEQYFKLHPRIILDDYFTKSSKDAFYKECNMLQISYIKWQDMVFDPVLSDKNDIELSSVLRNYLLFVAAIEHPDRWSKYYNDLCEKFDLLSFYRCKKISLTYRGNEDISQTAKRFYHDNDKNAFYYVGEWHDRLVFTDFIDELRDVLGSEVDRDLFLQIFVPKQNMQELEDFANDNCLDLDGDDVFRETLMKQLGVCLAKSDYEEDESEPELKEVLKHHSASTAITDIEEVEEGIQEIEDEIDVKSNDIDSDIIVDKDESLSSSPNLRNPTGIIVKCSDSINSGFKGLKSYVTDTEIYNNEDDEEDDESIISKRTISYTNNSNSRSENVDQMKKKNSSYHGKWEPAQQDSLDVRKRRNYSGYSPDKFKARQFNSGTQEPLTLSRRDISQDEIQYLSNLFGRALNIDTIKDENYIVRMRFYNSLKENGLEMDMTELEYIENGSSKIVTKNNKYIHRCSARSGILYISPTVWNRLREGRWVICFYSGKMADQFVYVRSQDELMEIINQDALVVQVTGNNKQEMVNRLYEDGFSTMDGNIYTLIRTIKVDGEVTPFDENITDYYSDDDDKETDEL